MAAIISRKPDIYPHVADLISIIKSRLPQLSDETLKRLKAVRDRFDLPDLDAAAAVSAYALHCLSDYIDAADGCISILCPETRREIQFLIR